MDGRATPSDAPARERYSEYASGGDQVGTIGDPDDVDAWVPSSLTVAVGPRT